MRRTVETRGTAKGFTNQTDREQPKEQQLTGVKGVLVPSEGAFKFFLNPPFGGLFYYTPSVVRCQNNPLFIHTSQ